MSVIKSAAMALGAIALLASVSAHAATNIASTGTASASATFTGMAGYDASKAIDGDLSTEWNAGGVPTQSFFLNFAAPVQVSAINAVIAQDPSGITKEEVYLDNTWAFTWYENTSMDSFLTYSFSSPVTFSQLEIRSVGVTAAENPVPSWVAWKEVQVMSADLPAPAPVPEPESWAMFGLGLAALGAVAKRKKQA